jgi:hypothetical protein
MRQLLAISTKLQVPALQSICYNFLQSHAPGQPITALALAELYSHADLYREASRFVLDQGKLSRPLLTWVGGTTNGQLLGM